MSLSVGAVIPFQHTSHFIPETAAEVAKVCPWDPYAALGMPRENINELLSWLSVQQSQDQGLHQRQLKSKRNEQHRDGDDSFFPLPSATLSREETCGITDIGSYATHNSNSDGSNGSNNNYTLAAEKIRIREATVTEAYRALAATFHPDVRERRAAGMMMMNRRQTTTTTTTTGAPGGEANPSSPYRASTNPANYLYTWISIEDRFAAIAAAAHVLRDVSLTLQYHAALLSQQQQQQHHITTFLAHHDKIQSLLSYLRQKEAQKERERMKWDIQRCRKAMLLRSQQEPIPSSSSSSSSSKNTHMLDGLVILLGLYGDLQTLKNQSQQQRQQNGFHRRVGGTHSKTSVSSSSLLLDPCEPEAAYPYWNSKALTNMLPDAAIDVTGALQVLIECNNDETDTSSSSSTSLQNTKSQVQLRLPRGTKVSVEGFWDPCNGFPKQLLVRYVFLGKIHQVIIDDEEPLRCPLRKHACCRSMAAGNKEQGVNDENSSSLLSQGGRGGGGIGVVPILPLASDIITSPRRISSPPLKPSTTEKNHEFLSLTPPPLREQSTNILHGDSRIMTKTIHTTTTNYNKGKKAIATGLRRVRHGGLTTGKKKNNNPSESMDSSSDVKLCVQSGIAAKFDQVAGDIQLVTRRPPPPPTTTTTTTTTTSSSSSFSVSSVTIIGVIMVTATLASAIAFKTSVLSSFSVDNTTLAMAAFSSGLKGVWGGWAKR